MDFLGRGRPVISCLLGFLSAPPRTFFSNNSKTFLFLLLMLLLVPNTQAATPVSSASVAYSTLGYAPDATAPGGEFDARWKWCVIKPKGSTCEQLYSSCAETSSSARASKVYAYAEVRGVVKNKRVDYSLSLDATDGSGNSVYWNSAKPDFRHASSARNQKPLARCVVYEITLNGLPGNWSFSLSFKDNLNNKEKQFSKPLLVTCSANRDCTSSQTCSSGACIPKTPPTPLPTASPTPTATPTQQPTPSPTPPTPSPTPTLVPSVTPAATPTSVPSPSVMPTATLTPTETPLETQNLTNCFQPPIISVSEIGTVTLDTVATDSRQAQITSRDEPTCPPVALNVSVAAPSHLDALATPSSLLLSPNESMFFTISISTRNNTPPLPLYTIFSANATNSSLSIDVREYFVKAFEAPSPTPEPLQQQMVDSRRGMVNAQMTLPRMAANVAQRYCNFKASTCGSTATPKNIFCLSEASANFVKQRYAEQGITTSVTQQGTFYCLNSNPPNLICVAPPTGSPHPTNEYTAYLRGECVLETITTPPLPTATPTPTFTPGQCDSTSTVVCQAAYNCCVRNFQPGECRDTFLQGRPLPNPNPYTCWQQFYTPSATPTPLPSTTPTPTGTPGQCNNPSAVMCPTSYDCCVRNFQPDECRNTFLSNKPLPNPDPYHCWQQFRTIPTATPTPIPTATPSSTPTPTGTPGQCDSTSTVVCQAAYNCCIRNFQPGECSYTFLQGKPLPNSNPYACWQQFYVATAPAQFGVSVSSYSDSFDAGFFGNLVWETTGSVTEAGIETTLQADKSGVVRKSAQVNSLGKYAALLAQSACANQIFARAYAKGTDGSTKYTDWKTISITPTCASVSAAAAGTVSLSACALQPVPAPTPPSGLPKCSFNAISCPWDMASSTQNIRCGSEQAAKFVKQQYDKLGLPTEIASGAQYCLIARQPNKICVSPPSGSPNPFDEYNRYAAGQCTVDEPAGACTNSDEIPFELGDINLAELGVSGVKMFTIGSCLDDGWLTTWCALDAGSTALMIVPDPSDVVGTGYAIAAAKMVRLTKSSGVLKELGSMQKLLSSTRKIGLTLKSGKRSLPTSQVAELAKQGLLELNFATGKIRTAFPEVMDFIGKYGDEAITRLKGGGSTNEMLETVATKNGNIAKTIRTGTSQKGIDWLEEGTSETGWKHIYDRHVITRNFEGIGIEDAQVQNKIFEAIHSPTDTLASPGGGWCFFSQVGQELFKVVVGSNGYIVSASPFGKLGTPLACR